MTEPVYTASRVYCGESITEAALVYAACVSPPTERVFWCAQERMMETAQLHRTWFNWTARCAVDCVAEAA